MTATDITIPRGADGPAPHPPARRRRRLGSRLSTGHVVMIVAGLVAAIANVALIRAGSDTVAVLVAREDVPVGTAVTAGHLRTVDARLDPDVLATLVTPAALQGGFLDDRVTTAPIAAGSLVRRDDLRPTATDEPGLRRMAIPVRPESAVGGAIAVDDRIDVIQVTDGVARYLVADARVLAKAETTGTTLGTVSSWFVTIGVDERTALCLAAAIETGGLTIVLSTGQPPASTSPCDPTAGAPPSSATGSPDVGPRPAPAEDAGGTPAR